MCPGYIIVPAKDVKMHETLTSFKRAGGMPEDWEATNMKIWRQAEGL